MDIAYEAVLTPTAPIQPPRIGEQAQVAGDPPGSDLRIRTRFTVALNVIGYPAISVPVELQLIGATSRKNRVLVHSGGDLPRDNQGESQPDRMSRQTTRRSAGAARTTFLTRSR